MSNSSDLNVWTVFWRSPDGKPWVYHSPPADRPRKPEPEERLFKASDVQKYQRMVLRHLPDAKFRCLSNVEIPGVEVVPLEFPDELVGWWAKMELFRPGLPPGRNLYFDLDTLILRLDGIADCTAPFACIEPGGAVGSDAPERWLDQEGRWRVPRYQTSVMAWSEERASQIWAWFKAGALHYLERLASDQDFLGEQFPNEHRWPNGWFSKVRRHPERPPRDMRVLLTMRMHNDRAAARYPWVKKLWH